MRIHATHILLVPKLEIFYLVKLNKRSQKKEITKDGIAQHYVYSMTTFIAEMRVTNPPLDSLSFEMAICQKFIGKRKE